MGEKDEGEQQGDADREGKIKRSVDEGDREADGKKAAGSVNIRKVELGGGRTWCFHRVGRRGGRGRASK